MLCSASYIYFDTREQINEIFDARLAQSARVMDQLLNKYLASRDTLKPIEVPEWLAHQPNDPNIWHNYERKLHFQVLDEKGAIILRSPNAPEKALGDLTLGFNHISIKDDRHEHERQWRTFTLKSKIDNRWLIAAERDDVRGELTGKIAKRSLYSIWISLPILSLLLIYILKKGLYPVAELTKTIANRSPKDFEHFEAKYPTQELSPLYQELNRLLDAQKTTLEREKQFTDSAAHELRTPLTILKINAENALNAKDKDEQKKSLEKLVQGIDRSSRLIQQLLVLARLENPRNISMATVSLNEVLRDTIAELTPLALRKQQQIELEVDNRSYLFASNVALLNILFGNLIDNAIRYTPMRGAITIHASEEGEVRISDNGAGVAPHLLSRLGEAFFRADSSKGDGTGLGLSIVKRISELLGISVQFSNRQPVGFVAIVRVIESKQPGNLLHS